MNEINELTATKSNDTSIKRSSSLNDTKRKKKRHLVATSVGTRITIFDVNNFLADIDAPAECPHIKDVNVTPDLKKLNCFGHFGDNRTNTTLSETLKRGDADVCGCLVCSDKSESWLCLHCMRVFCGRYVQEHSAMHAKNSKHHIAMSLKGLSFWCYACDRYLEHSFNSKLHSLYTSAHRIKFPEERKPPLDPFAKRVVGSPRKKIDKTPVKFARRMVLERQNSLLGGKAILSETSREDEEFDANTFVWV